MILNTFLESRVCIVRAHLADLFLHPMKGDFRIKFAMTEDRIGTYFICKVLKKFIISRKRLKGL